MTENDIRRLVKESVKRIVREEYQNKDADYWLEHSPSRQFTVDNKGKEAMKKLKDMEDGGVKMNKKQKQDESRRMSSKKMSGERDGWSDEKILKTHQDLNKKKEQDEARIRRAVRESIKHVLRENMSLGNKRPLREFGWDENRDDLIGMTMEDAIAQLESEGWKWNPNDETRDQNDETTITTHLYPGPKKRTGRYRPYVYLKCKCDDSTQMITVITAIETWN